MNKPELFELLKKRVSEMRYGDECIVSRSPLMSDTYVQILPIENESRKKRGRSNVFGMKVLTELRALFPEDKSTISNNVGHIRWENIY